MIKIKRTNCIVAVFDDDATMMNALKATQAKGHEVIDVFTPFPVHGLERVLGIKRSNLAITAFVFGCIGLGCGLALTTYTMTYDWPMIIGGKPTWPLLSFVPVLFELTVLIAALGMVATFMTVNKLAPGVLPVIYDKRATSDRFVVLYKEDAKAEDVRALITQYGAVEMRNDVHVDHNFPGPLPIKLK